MKIPFEFYFTAKGVCFPLLVKFNSSSLPFSSTELCSAPPDKLYVYSLITRNLWFYSRSRFVLLDNNKRNERTLVANFIIKLWQIFHPSLVSLDVGCCIRELGHKSCRTYFPVKINSTNLHVLLLNLCGESKNDTWPILHTSLLTYLTYFLPCGLFIWGEIE